MMSGVSMPLADTRRHLGDFGESVVAAYLARRGYAILERKWRCSVGEVDLIARHGDQVVFLEVRTRRGAMRGSAEESITPTKQQRLIALAYAYLDTYCLSDTTPWRIDVVAVEVDRAGRVTHLNHIRNAVEQ